MAEWLYGRNAVYEALRAGRRSFSQLKVASGSQASGRLADILQLSQSKGLKAESVSRQELDSYGEGHQGVALKASDYAYSDLGAMLALARQKEEAPLLLLLDALQDPQNLGTLFRTAEAVGVHGVILPPRRTATVTPAVVNASSGACEHLLVGQQNLAQAIRTLKEEDVWVVGLEGSPEAQPPEKIRLDGALALVVGSEGEGMRRLVRESCDLLMRLPMRGQVASLNAAVAGSIALYMAWQARGYA